jgi:hypothetical protein
MACRQPGKRIALVHRMRKFDGSAEWARSGLQIDARHAKLQGSHANLALVEQT